MKTKNNSLLIFLSLILALTFAVPASYARGRDNNAAPPKQETAAQGHDKIDVNNLPVQVRDAVKSAYPNADIKEAVRVNEGSSEVYRVKISDNNVDRFLLYNPSGNLIETSVNVDKDQLPPAIRTSLERDYPNLDIEKVDKVSKDGVTTWQVIIEQKDQHLLVTFDESGNRLSVQPQSKDVEDRMIGEDKK